MRNATPFTLAASMAVLAACSADSAPDSREFVVTVDNLAPSESLYQAGSFDTPDAELLSGPIRPGQSYSFDVVVHPGAQLQLITMFVESNDAFLAFEPRGVALWTPGGEVIDGDRTDELVIYDAGTEVNEPLGAGEFQAPRQPSAGAGVDEQGSISRISEDDEEYPDVSEFVELHVIHLEGPNFRVVLSNVSPDDLLAPASELPKPALLSPGVFTVHEPGVEWFRPGELASPTLERLAEDGDPGPALEVFEYLEGVASDLSAVVWAVHGSELELYELGASAGAGLEDLIEDGRPQVLLDELDELDEARADLVDYGLAESEAMPVIEPGASVELRFRAAPGDRFSFVTGYLAANDKLIGARGIPLFEDEGAPRTGELGWALELLDAGTELDEPPGLGRNQFERQSGAGAGPDEGGLIQAVHGEWQGWDYPPAQELVRVRVAVVDE